MITKLPPKTTSITEMSIADIGGDDRFCPRMWAGMTFCFVVTLVVMTATGVAIEDKRSQYRQPAAILLDSGDTALVVANKNSGSISTVLLSHGEVQEYPLGKSLRDLHRLPGDRFLTVDFVDHQLIEFRVENAVVSLVSRTPVAQYPHCVIATQNGRFVFVSSLWSRRLTILESVADGQKWKTAAVVDLDFAPREMALVKSEKKLIVADNFGGRLAVLDCENYRIELEHRVTAHNIRGLHLADQDSMLVATHQMLNELAHTSRNDIHWGLLMSNDLRWIPVEAFLQKKRPLYQLAHMHPLGKENHAAGDPGNFDIADDGTVVVTISGVDEIAFGKEDDFQLKRLKVGNRPVDVAIDSTGKKAFIANSFDDSVSVFDLTTEKVEGTIALGKLRQLTGIEKGEQLFFDASLSHDGWMSCHSCHSDGHTNGGLNDNFSDGSFGSPKKVLTLRGLTGTEPFAWNGHIKTMEDQIRVSLESTMKSKVAPRGEWIRAISAFVGQLPSPPALATARGEQNAQVVRDGREVFRDLGCAVCHRGSRLTSPQLFDVGLEDEQGNTKFNPPSLVGVSQRNAFFHDGRAKKIEDVFFQFRHKIPPRTPEKDIHKLVQFLRSL